MNVQVKKPDIERYIAQQVEAGHFPTAEAVVEDAILRAMNEQVELTPEDLQAIAISEEQFERGEGIDASEVAARLRPAFLFSTNAAHQS